MSFAEKGVVPFYAAMALIIGANIGTALNPLARRRAGRRGGRPARRGREHRHAPCRGGGRPAAPVRGSASSLFRSSPNLSRAVADFHTAFNLVLGLAFLPLLGPLRAASRAAAARPIERRRSRAAALSRRRGGGDARRSRSVMRAREVLRMVDVLDVDDRGRRGRVAPSGPRGHRADAPPGRCARRAEQRDQALRHPPRSRRA